MVILVETDVEMVKERLRSVGMRITAPRLAVLTAVQDGGHLTADTIAVFARARLGSLSQQAVYDNLNALLGVGLIRRIEPANSPALYEARIGDNHHHLVCRNCGRVEDMDCAVGRRPCLEPTETHGFLIEEAEVIFWGICPTCQNPASLAKTDTGKASDIPVGNETITLALARGTHLAAPH